MARKNGSNGERIERVEKGIKDLKNSFEEQKASYEKQKALYENHVRRHVIDDLQETRYNNKPLYSYADIADRYDISVNAVQKIASEENLTRRNRA